MNNTLDKLIEEFYKKYKDREITEKTYDITIVRGLVIYFAYSAGKKNKKKKITFSEIAKKIGIERTTATKAFHRTEAIVVNYKKYNFSNENHKKIFTTFYFLFKKIK